MHRKSLTLALLLFTLLLVQVVQAQPPGTAQTPCTPGISFWSLLGSVGVGYADGRLNIDKLYAVCLPAPSNRVPVYEYDPDAGGKLDRDQRRTASNNTYVWYGHNITGLWELSSTR